MADAYIGSLHPDDPLQPGMMINGVYQGTYKQREAAEKFSKDKNKADLARRAASAKKAKARRQDAAMSGKNAPKSPSPSDIQAGHFRTTNYTKPVK